MNTLNQILKSDPEIALFAALFLGHALGRVKVKGFSLGGVAGSLIVALADRTTGHHAAGLARKPSASRCSSIPSVSKADRSFSAA